MCKALRSFDFLEVYLCFQQWIRGCQTTVHLLEYELYISYYHYLVSKLDFSKVMIISISDALSQNLYMKWFGTRWKLFRHDIFFATPAKFTPHCLHKHIRKHLTFHGQIFPLSCRVVSDYFGTQIKHTCNNSLLL